MMSVSACVSISGSGLSPITVNCKGFSIGGNTTSFTEQFWMCQVGVTVREEECTSGFQPNMKNYRSLYHHQAELVITYKCGKRY
ncbi:hypothetical protein E2C01_000441 [Portunus trituberculatus]|uniref:Uncharacterized protein n=1 Tax=Portunus trituberculatus TaxID=210409 RepID=A0A5B7CJR9_PORTR|nr:hypothetical protein [Portunus trituberculatus]